MFSNNSLPPAKPKIDEIQSSNTQVNFQEKTTASLTCVVTGTPEPEIKWYRGQQILQGIQ